MSVIWVSQDDQPVATAPVILAEHLVRRALMDSDAGAVFEDCYQHFVVACGSELRTLLTSAGRGEPVSPESSLLERVQAAFQPWCEAWGGVSEHILGQTVTVAILRFYRVPRRQATRRDRELVLAPLGLDVDKDFETLLDSHQPQSRKNDRKQARVKALANNLKPWQTARLRKWADLWWQARVTHETSLRVLAELQGIDERNFIRELKSWDEAAGYVRRGAIPTNI